MSQQISKCIVSRCLIFIGLGLAIAPGAWSRGQAKAQADSPVAYRFSQECKTAGAQEVIVSASSICVKSRKGGLVALFAAPYDQIYLYNTQSKKYISVPFHKYNSPFSYMWNALYNQNLADVPLTPPVAVSFRPVGVKAKNITLPAWRFNSTAAYTSERMQSRRLDDIPSRCIMTLAYTTTDKVSAAPEIGHLLQKMYGLPEVSGIPVSFVFRNFNNEAKDYLVTSDVQQVKTCSADFTRPTGYVLAQTVEEVTSVVNDSIELFGP